MDMLHKLMLVIGLLMICIVFVCWCIAMLSLIFKDVIRTIHRYKGR